MKSNRDHNSSRLFCNGEPERIIRCGVLICFTVRVTCGNHVTNKAKSVLEFQLESPKEGRAYLRIWITYFMTFVQNHVMPIVSQQFFTILHHANVRGDQKSARFEHFPDQRFSLTCQSWTLSISVHAKPQSSLSEPLPAHLSTTPKRAEWRYVSEEAICGTLSPTDALTWSGTRLTTVPVHDTVHAYSSAYCRTNPRRRISFGWSCPSPFRLPVFLQLPADAAPITIGLPLFGN